MIILRRLMIAADGRLFYRRRYRAVSAPRSAAEKYRYFWGEWQPCPESRLAYAGARRGLNGARVEFYVAGRRKGNAVILRKITDNNLGVFWDVAETGVIK